MKNGRGNRRYKLGDAWNTGEGDIGAYKYKQWYRDGGTIKYLMTSGKKIRENAIMAGGIRGAK
jgi:hypothetical protein